MIPLKSNIAMATDISDSQSSHSSQYGSPCYATRWSMVLRAGDSSSPEQMEALNLLCESYRPAVLSYVRSKGFKPEDAEDLTQSFFAHLLKKKPFPSSHPAGVGFGAFCSLRCGISWPIIGTKTSGSSAAGASPLYHSMT